MSRWRVVAVAVLAATALVAGGVALALHGTGRRPAGSPAAFSTPTDVTVSAPTGPGIEVGVGRLQVGSLSRTYLLLAPPDPDPSTPLVVGLHGRNATPGEEAARDGLAPYVAAGQAILVYPVGYQQAWNVGDGCCGLGVAAGLDDVAFVGQVVDAVRARFGLTGPTDLVGYSNGGRLAYAIACRDVTRYDAVVAISASPPDLPCPQAGVPVPFFAGVFGGDDELPTHEDPQPVTQVLAALTADLVDRDGCLGDPTVASAGRVVVRAWTACQDGTFVQTAVWDAAGHHWPEAQYVGRPDGGDLVWSFLSGVHARG